MKKINVGIIGQGRSGFGIHSSTLAHPKLRDRFNVIAVCDFQIDRCKDSCELHEGCKSYTDYREMFKNSDIELIVNASRSHDHARISIEALEAGFKVLSEKPLAKNIAEVEKLEETIKRTGNFFTIFQQSRFAPTFLKVKEVIESGVLGRPVMIKVAFNGFARRWDWQTLQDMVAGNLYNTGPHPLDQALQLMGDVMPEKITCYMDRANTYGDAEDHVKLLMSKPGYPVVDLEISSCMIYTPYAYQVYGTNGSLTGTHSDLSWKWFDPIEAPDQKLIREPLEGRAYCGERLTFYEGSWKTSEEGLEFASRSEKLYLNLYDALVNGKELVVSLEQVKRQIAVMEECHRQNPLSKLEN